MACSSTSKKTTEEEKKFLTIDAGDLVWSLSIGQSSQLSSTRQTTWKNWFRYKPCLDLVLAVGLNNGQIRTFDLLTGMLTEVVVHVTVFRLWYGRCRTAVNFYVYCSVRMILQYVSCIP